MTDETQTPAASETPAPQDPTTGTQFPVVIPLKHPIKLGSEQWVRSISIRKPKGRDIRRIPMQKDFGMFMKWGEILSGETPFVFDEMDKEDLDAVFAVIIPLFPESPED